MRMISQIIDATSRLLGIHSIRKSARLFQFKIQFGSQFVGQVLELVDEPVEPVFPFEFDPGWFGSCPVWVGFGRGAGGVKPGSPCVSGSVGRGLDGRSGFDRLLMYFSFDLIREIDSRK